MRVAIYARVSTEDKGQDPENQLRDLRAWCADSGHDLVGEYVDRVSGRAVRDQGRAWCPHIATTSPGLTAHAGRLADRDAAGFNSAVPAQSLSAVF
jgi:hypothetical protein